MNGSSVQDLVSVIIPVHNRAAELIECVESVLAQSHRSFQVIIVDDGSTDETGGTADRLSREWPEKIEVVHIANSGPGTAREVGRSMASGEFIQYLDSDDLLLPMKFAMQIGALRDAPQCQISYGNSVYLNQRGERIVPDWKTPLAGETSLFPAFLIARRWETANPLYRRSLTDAMGPWSDLWLEEDWEYDCRAAALGAPLAYVNADVCVQRDIAVSRLSRGHALDPRRLRYRAQAHERILASANRARVEPSSPELEHFARELFLVARQCGSAGLARESRLLLELSARAHARPDAKLTAYTWVTRILGTRIPGMAATLTDSAREKFRRRRSR